MTDPKTSEIARQLLEAKRVLVFTHLRPDGDALGSSCGLRSFLRSLGKEAEVLLPDGFPRRYLSLCSGELTHISRKEAEKFDLFISIDCANIPRLGVSEELDIDFLRGKNFINVDHHAKNNLEAPLEWVDTTASSGSQMAAEIALQIGGESITAETATLLLSGMMTDTGCFCFSNTSGRALRVAAELYDRGADVERITNALFFSKPLHQLAFESEMISSCLRLAHDGRFAYAFLPEELMKKHHFELKEDEGLIDLLRGIEGVKIAMLCHKRPDGFRVSLRSKEHAFPVGPLARELGGGGHDMAAGCTVAADDFSVVEKLMTEKIGALFAHPVL